MGDDTKADIGDLVKSWISGFDGAMDFRYVSASVPQATKS